MKKAAMIITAMIMAIIMAGFTPLKTYAVGEQVGKLINALSIAYGRDEMASNGFTLLDSDLNSGTTECDVFLGYQTTDEPKNAITDIKAVQEKNGYIIFDAEEIMANLQGEAMEDAIYLNRVVTEFRANYNAGQKFAQYAFKWLQLYKISDTQQLGDFLINPDLTANDLTNIVLNAAPDMTNGLYMYLCIGLIKDDNDTFLNRLASLDEDDYEVDNVLKGKARELLSAIQSYQLYISQSINALGNDDENADSTIFACSDLLALYEIDGMNLFDYLMRTNIKASDLYPLASVISDNELQIAKFLGFKQFILAESWGYAGIESFPSLDDLADDKLYDFWDGSTQRLGGRIAVTNELLQQMIVGNAASLSDLLLTTRNGIGVGAVLLGLGTIGFAILNSARASANLAAQMSTTVGRIGSAISKFAGATGQSLQKAAVAFTGMVAETRAGIASISSLSNMGAQMMRTASLMTANGACKAATAVTAARASIVTASKLMSATIVLTVVAILVCVLFFVIDIMHYYSPEFSECPAVVLSQETLADGSTGYVTYYSVNYGTGNSPADTNGREGKAWNALYYTTSSTMGAPLRAGSITVTHSASNWGGKQYAVTCFGSTAPFDLNTNAYTHKHGVYMYFDRVDEDTLASVFTTPNIIIMCAAVVLLAGAATVTVILSNKKRQQKSPIPPRRRSNTCFSKLIGR